MAQIDSQLSTGLAGLDKTLKGLIPGDNIVWQVESVDDYAPFLPPYCQAAEALDTLVAAHGHQVQAHGHGFQ